MKFYFKSRQKLVFLHIRSTPSYKLSYQTPVNFHQATLSPYKIHHHLMQNYLYKKTFLIKTKFAVNGNYKSLRLLSSKEQRQTEVFLQLPLIIFQASKQSCVMDFNSAESSELQILRQDGFYDFNSQNKFDPLKPYHASSAQKIWGKMKGAGGSLANEIEIHGFKEQKVA